MSTIDPVDDAPELAALLASPGVKSAGACRVCGCTQARACTCPEIGPCWWVEPGLCSHCAEPAIVVALFEDMQRRLVAGNPFVRFELGHWSKRAYSALQRASTSDAGLFEL